METSATREMICDDTTDETTMVVVAA